MLPCAYTLPDDGHNSPKPMAVPGRYSNCTRLLATANPAIETVPREDTKICTQNFAKLKHAVFHTGGNTDAQDVSDHV